MKMFNIILMFTCLLFTSCSDFLNETPKGAQMQETFYKTDSEMLGGLMGLYARIINSEDGPVHNFITRNAGCSDLHTYKPIASADAVAFCKYTLTSTTPPLVTSWAYCYSVINSINSFVTVLENTTNTTLSKDLKALYLKEAKFFRALMYFHLIMRWGDVPLRLVPVDVTNTDIIRSPQIEVWQQVIKDLNEAIQLPGKDKMDKGRINKGAALTLLAKTYLMMGDFENAEISLNQIEGYSLIPDIRDIWNINRKFNNESIWEVNREQGTLPKQSLGMLCFFLPMHDTFKGTCSTHPVNDYVLSMIEKDSPRSKLYYTKKPLSTEISSKYKGEYTYSTTSGEEKTIVFNKNTCPPFSHLMKNVDFTNAGEKFDVGDSPFNLIIYRYADVVLMKAEVECQLNGPTELGLSYLNQIRVRAGETKYTYTNEKGLIPICCQSELREAIRKERALELIGEGHRFYDLKRWGTEYALTKLSLSRQVHIKGTEKCYKPEDLNNIKDYRLLWPIPDEEMKGNKLMKQNPGY